MTAKARHKHAQPDMDCGPDNIIHDPSALPDLYALRVSGNCLAPDIQHGDAVLIDKSQPYGAGDLVCVFFKPEYVEPGGRQLYVKRLVFDMMPGATFPYEHNPRSNVMPLLICEQDNPYQQYTVPADRILAIHRCMGLVPDEAVLTDPETGKPQYQEAEPAVAAGAGFSRRAILAGAAAIVPTAGLASVPALADDSADAELLELGRQWQAIKERIDELYRPEREASERAKAMKPPMPEALQIRPGDKKLIGQWLRLSPAEERAGYYGFAEVNRFRGMRCSLNTRHYVRVGTWEPISKAEADKLDLLREVVPYFGEPVHYPEAQARVDEIVAAWDEWQAAVRAVKEEAGCFDPRIEELGAAADDLDCERMEIERAIAGLPATTIAGLYVKAVLMATECRDDDQRLIEDDPEDYTDSRVSLGIYRDLRAMLGTRA